MSAAGRAARGTFAVASAVTAAALGDPIVEGLANAGVFGAGRFTDRSTADVLPALLVGVLIAAIYVASLIRRFLAPEWRAAGWLQQSALILNGASVRRMLPLMLVLQIVVLLVMETIEQRAVFGHLLGGSLWLGGPVAASIAIHALVGVLVAFVFAQSLRRVATRVAAIIRFALRLMLALADPVRARRCDLVGLPPRRLPLGHLAHLGERAPPLCTI
jgi:hypothetical protein